MDKDTSITDILYPGVTLDCDLDGLIISSIIRIENEFIIVLGTRKDDVTLVFGWNEDTASAAATANACEETLLYWQSQGTDLYLIGAPGKPYLLYASLLQGVCIPRSA